MNYSTHPSTHLAAILEIAAHPDKNREHDRFAGIIEVLKHSSIAGFPVAHVHYCQGEDFKPILVPGFGHSIRCNEKHVCELQTWGVLRYFNVHLYVEGHPPVEILQTYTINHPSIARLDVCGLYERNDPGERNELQPMQEKTEATSEAKP